MMKIEKLLCSIEDQVLQGEVNETTKLIFDLIQSWGKLAIDISNHIEKDDKG